MSKKTAVENLPELVNNDNDNKFSIFLAMTVMPDGDSFNVSNMKMIFMGRTLDNKVVDSAVSKLKERLDVPDDLTDVIRVECGKKKTVSSIKSITNGEF